MNASKTIEVFQGNTDVIPVSVLDGTGAAFTLTGYTCQFKVKEDKDSSGTLISVTAEVGHIVSNVVSFHLSETDTDIEEGTYWYEILVSNENIDPAVIKTVAQGVFNLLDSLYL